VVEKTNTKPDRKYTYQDYLKLPDEPGFRYEILEGELIKDPSPGVQHQRISRRLQRILEDYFWETDPKGEVFDAPLDVTLQESTVVQPDLIYVADMQKDIIKTTRIDGPPYLAVEILSPSTRRKDRITKMNIYKKAGVLHYWLVDPQDQVLQCFFLQGDNYVLLIQGKEDIISHPVFTGLEINLDKLW